MRRDVFPRLLRKLRSSRASPFRQRSHSGPAIAVSPVCLPSPSECEKPSANLEDRVRQKRCLSRAPAWVGVGRCGRGECALRRVRTIGYRCTAACVDVLFRHMPSMRSYGPQDVGLHTSILGQRLSSFCGRAIVSRSLYRESRALSIEQFSPIN